MRRPLAVLVLLVLVSSLVLTGPAHAFYRAAHDFRLRHVTVQGVVKLLVTAHIAASSTPMRGLGGGEAECAEKVPVKVQRRSGGSWKTIKKTKTTARAKVRVKVADRTGRYRLVLPAYTSPGGFDCFKAKSAAKRHGH